MIIYYGYISIELIFHLIYLNLPFHIDIFNFMKIANAKITTKMLLLFSINLIYSIIIYEERNNNRNIALAY